MGPIELVSGPAQLSVSRRGAEPISWSVAGVPLLWTPDEKVWPQTAPILFPIVGWARDGQVRHRGKSFALGVHGFAARSDFKSLDQAHDSVRLRLEADSSTRASYPFEFRLDVVYRLEPDALDWVLEVENRGDEPMPYAVGLHPGFCWPLAGSTAPHSLRFDRPERSDVPEIAPGGLFSNASRALSLRAERTGEGTRVLDLTAVLMEREALCFLNIASTGAVFDNGAGARLRVDLRNFPHLALWSRPPAPFLCIEAWTGHGDPVGFAGELADKPSMLMLAPGASARHSARFSFTSAAV